ncbi:MAG: rpsE [Candidatus Saccharibacteria bacterium]|nr:rpsE [Candidatus Saccharibacteria bacterium]
MLNDLLLLPMLLVRKDWFSNMADQRNNSRGNNNRRDQAPQEPKQFEELVINIDRVSRVVKGGRRFRFKALVVVGDRKTKVGVGVAKGADVQAAVAKATDIAKKNLIIIPIINETIPHDVELKFSGARVLLKPAAPGTGIIAGGVVRSIIGVTGIRNLLSKSLNSTNKVNIAYATVAALDSLVAKEDWLTNAAPKKKAKAVITDAEAVEEAPVAKPAVKAKAAAKETK